MAIIAGGIDTLVYCMIVLLASRKRTVSFFDNYGTKISVILLLAKFFNDYPNHSKKFIYTLIAIFFVLVPSFLIINQF